MKSVCIVCGRGRDGLKGPFGTSLILAKDSLILVRTSQFLEKLECSLLVISIDT